MMTQRSLYSDDDTMMTMLSLGQNVVVVGVHLAKRRRVVVHDVVVTHHGVVRAWNTTEPPALAALLPIASVPSACNLSRTA